MYSETKYTEIFHLELFSFTLDKHNGFFICVFKKNNANKNDFLRRLKFFILKIKLVLLSILEG